MTLIDPTFPQNLTFHAYPNQTFEANLKDDLEVALNQEKDLYHLMVNTNIDSYLFYN